MLHSFYWKYNKDLKKYALFYKKIFQEYRANMRLNLTL